MALYRNLLTNLCYLVHYNWTQMIMHYVVEWDDCTNLLCNIADNIGDRFREIINRTNKMTNTSL